MSWQGGDNQRVTLALVRRVSLPGYSGEGWRFRGWLLGKMYIPLYQGSSVKITYLEVLLLV